MSIDGDIFSGDHFKSFQDQAISALSCNQWDLSKATDYVFG
uniref:Uncharacterized protein n=1 Tax=Parascaris equorum TaxID=6256 RepID=A0A914RUB6_PAREQ